MNKDLETDLKLRTYTKIAGITYLIIILLGIFSVNVVESSLVTKGKSAELYQNIFSNEFLFRVGVVSELLMYLLVVILSLSLFVILKSINKNLALLALLLRTAEAIVGSATIVLSGLIPLYLSKIKEGLSIEYVHSIANLFLYTRTSGLNIVLLFVGVGGVIFCYLFLKSKYVPKFLAGWGIFTYLSMILLSLTSFLLPNLPETYKMYLYTPGALFEIIFGLWLFIKGVKIK